MWAALGNIILVNIVLSGDNAVVIAMAARGLAGQAPEAGDHLGQRRGDRDAGHPDDLRRQLLKYPYLKIVGGLLLFWIGIQLCPKATTTSERSRHTALGGVRTILVADLVMSSTT
jgi:predicted tellurium resistance membrane protein TerC